MRSWMAWSTPSWVGREYWRSAVIRSGLRSHLVRRALQDLRESFHLAAQAGTPVPSDRQEETVRYVRGLPDDVLLESEGTW